MKKILVALAALAAHAAFGCAAAPDSTPESEDPAVQSGEAPSALAPGLVDASGLTQLGPLGRPARTFEPHAALSNERLARVLLGGQKAERAGVLGRQSLWESEGFRIQKNEDFGEMYLRIKEELWDRPAPQAVDEQALEAESLAVLRDLGLPAEETGLVMQRTVARHDAGAAEAEVHQHLTIVDRAFNGIPVRGSRAVVVYDAAGRRNHVMVHWRPIAKEGTPGQQWGTKMRVADIVERATERLADLGLGDRPARLSYQYVPVDPARTDGPVAFALRCVAMVGVNPALRVEQRPVEIDIELD